MEFRAIFCPSCGYCLDEGMDVEGIPSPSPTSDPTKDISGTGFTCGYCGTRTRDWNHLRRCRYEHRVRDRLTVEQAVAGLRVIEMELAQKETKASSTGTDS